MEGVTEGEQSGRGCLGRVQPLLEQLSHSGRRSGCGCLDLELECLTDLCGGVMVDLHRYFECALTCLYDP